MLHFLHMHIALLVDAELFFPLFLAPVWFVRRVVILTDFVRRGGEGLMMITLLLSLLLGCE